MDVLGLKSEAESFLNGVIEAKLEPQKAYAIIEEMEDVLVYLLMQYLREKHAHDHGVLERLLHLTQHFPDLIMKCKRGEKDSLVEWFKDTYNPRSLGVEEFVEIVVEKLEG
jgi:hypothetical protein